MDSDADKAAAVQSALWNGPAGRAWADLQALLDRTLTPFEVPLLDAVAGVASSSSTPARVLDVGCGTGGTSLAAARRLGAAGRVAGVDISEPMLAVARARAQREALAVEFVRADAQTHAFAPASIDLLISRFGVMFFDDPVRAFANLRTAMRDGAALRFVCWRSGADNPFMLTAERAAAPLLPQLAARRPGAPGQMAFADPDRVRAILRDSGWTAIEIDPLDVTCTLPESELVTYFTRLGPVGNALEGVDRATLSKVIEAVRPAFDRYVHGDEVRFGAACWSVGARSFTPPREA